MALVILAVDVSIHGKGVGSALLKDALLRTAQAAETIGARALIMKDLLAIVAE
jgi:predicted N-acetyltransferase YhbS